MDMFNYPGKHITDVIVNTNYCTQGGTNINPS